MNDPSAPYRSSKGHALAASGWQDTHFDAKRPEYEAMLRLVGLRRGWSVLDAGAGNGSYLPWLAEAVGPTGRLTAMDIAPENIAVIDQRIPYWSLDCPVETVVDSLLTIPFEDAHFDAVWCANTTQYLTDNELVTGLQEFRRVVRPGGIVAVKEAMVTTWNIAPGDPARLWRLLDALQGSEVQIDGLLRAPELGSYLMRSGLQDVWQKLTPVERRPPLRSSERQFISEILAWLASKADRVALSDSDVAFWQTVLDPKDPSHPVNSPDLYYYDVPLVTVGRVPLTA